jgi:hypothetical protein
MPSLPRGSRQGQRLEHHSISLFRAVPHRHTGDVVKLCRSGFEFDPPLEERARRFHAAPPHARDGLSDVAVFGGTRTRKLVARTTIDVLIARRQATESIIFDSPHNTSHHTRFFRRIIAEFFLEKLSAWGWPISAPAFKAFSASAKTRIVKMTFLRYRPCVQTVECRHDH